MAHQSRPVRGPEVNRGGRDLHSSHQNTEDQNEIASLPQRDKLPEYQKTAYDIMARWIGPLHQEKVWMDFRSMVQVMEELGAERGWAEGRDRRPLLKPLARLPPQHRRGLAAVAARGGAVGTVQTPRATPLAVSSRVHREIVIK
ncbi:hypothetical protein E4U24_004232 [Claviceps purpurea]|nr:hypothetical protein E4U36_005144 [Claviceps purpurea]KAG6245743.1 hypothetical protein E4U24_004232 [Claviceps purpurea]KAG6300795.1 hypothetical protein E4U45_003683 [Claviceps purpurea]